MHVGNTDLNYFHFLLQLLVPVQEDFLLLLMSLHLGLQVLLQFVVGNLDSIELFFQLPLLLHAEFHICSMLPVLGLQLSFQVLLQ